MKRVAILTRAIPVSNYSIDTLSLILDDSTTVAEVMKWANGKCGGAAELVRVEIVEADESKSPHGD